MGRAGPSTHPPVAGGWQAVELLGWSLAVRSLLGRTLRLVSPRPAGPASAVTPHATDKSRRRPRRRWSYVFNSSCYNPLEMVRGREGGGGEGTAAGTVRTGRAGPCLTGMNGFQVRALPGLS